MTLPNLSDSDHKAMVLFEKATDMELRGRMSDAVSLYREAFKLSERIDLLYRTHKVPKAALKIRQELGKNSTVRVDEEAVRKIDAEKLIESFASSVACAPDPVVEGDEKPVSKLEELPTDVWTRIMQLLVVEQPEAWFRFGLTCKRNAYIAFHPSLVWCLFCNLVYPRQIYEENAVEEVVPRDPSQVLSQYPSWKRMLRERPFVKFGGCYISVVNYYSEGGRLELSTDWKNPVRTITYFRYMRFFADGSCLMAQAAVEPEIVVDQLRRDNKLKRILKDGKDPASVNPQLEPHRIHAGHWTINTAGQVHVVLEQNAMPYYTLHYVFKVKSLGPVPHGKLAWDRYFGIRKQMHEGDDREGEYEEFRIGKETPFKFSRVRSYDETQ